MKRLKVSTIISVILCINYLLIPNSMVYADSLVHVHKDYNNSSNSVDLYVNGIEDTVTDVSVTVDSQSCDVEYYNLTDSNVQSDVYFLISVSNFNDSVDATQKEKINVQIGNLLEYLLNHKPLNTTYHFSYGILNSKSISISSAKDVENVEWTNLNCALNMCVQNILTSIEGKSTLSKIVIISDGTNEANPTIKSSDVINTLNSIPCEIIPITVSPLSSKDVTIEDINKYNITNAPNFSLSSEYSDILSQIEDWSKIGIFDVNLDGISTDSQTKPLKLSYKDQNKTVSIDYTLKMPSQNTNSIYLENSEDDSKIKHIIVAILTTLLIVVIVLMIVVKKNNHMIEK